MHNMTINALHVLFKNVSITSILESYRKYDNKISHAGIDKEYFVRVWQNRISNYSIDEVGNIYEAVISKMSKDNSLHKSIFHIVLALSNEMLLENNGKPEVKFEHLLRWQYATQILGQDMFTTAFFAQSDNYSCRDRTNFLWAPVIKSNNYRLKKILERGIAENHYHLKGSSQIFAFSWASLMCDVSKRKNEFEKFEADINPLTKELVVGSGDKALSYLHIVKMAHAIRTHLFMKEILGKDLTFDINKILNENEDEIDLEISKVYAETENLLENSYKFDYNENNYIIDYVINDINLVNPNYECDSGYVLAGERYFMYRIFKKLFSNTLSEESSNLFYLYSVIKTKFRMELIQSNRKIGFRNFSQFQDRKTIFIKRNAALYRLFHEAAVLLPLEDANIIRFETRLGTESNTKDLIKSIKETDNLIYNTAGDDYKNFYTLHFIKNPDKLLDNDLFALAYPRHYALRQEIKNSTRAIMSIREKGKLGLRIRGIDACNHEIGCRPEVFAQAFRTLRNHNVNAFNTNKFPQLSHLGITYHVGEDFLDVIDGLRAVDEAITFLRYQSGDRLGHALVMGINALEWYEMKDFCISLPKQDLMDNLAWFYCKVKEVGVNLPLTLMLKIEQDFFDLFNEVYADFTDRPSMLNYYKAMSLRGDNPEYYYKEELEISQSELSFWDRNAIDPQNSKKNYSSQEKLLYIAYHYNSSVKKSGAAPTIYKMSKEIIPYISILQKEMLKDFSRKGLSIETNPTSNYLIGTFKRYDNHPILKFYNLGLVNDPQLLEDCPQITVSINTDDQGVFDTYLENEYALLALALEKAKDEYGRPKYNVTQIYNWLNSIREMGIDQSFL